MLACPKSEYFDMDMVYNASTFLTKYGKCLVVWL